MPALRHGWVGSHEPGLISYARYAPYDSTQALRTDTSMLYVNFELGKAELKPDYRNNATILKKMEARINRMLNDSLLRVRTIMIVGMASIEGSYNYNSRLALQRANAVKNYLQEKFQLPDDKFEVVNGREAWSEFRSYAADHQFEGRQQVLDIIDRTTNLSHRESQIRALNGGNTYRYLFNNLFADQRSAGYMKIYYDRLNAHKLSADRLVFAESPAAPGMLPAYVAPQARKEGPWWIAVKTNMLFDAALAPNIEVERWFGKNDRFSVMAEVWFPWYVWKSNSRAYEILTIGLEGRYWFSKSKKHPNRPLTGWFAGIYAAGGKYDVEWNSKGYQGEFTSLGASIGYTWRIGRNLNLEASASAGWVSGPYRKYEGMFNDTHLIWQHNGKLNYFGPTKLKFSLVWLWPERRKK